MYYADEITKIHEVIDDPEVRPMGPIGTKPLWIKMSLGGTEERTAQRISQDAAVELVAALLPRLKARGCL